MTDLADKKCIPCEGGIPSFDTNEIHKYLKKVDVWDVMADDNKTYYLITVICMSAILVPVAPVLISEFNFLKKLYESLLLKKDSRFKSLD